jgi:hypothetical protein
MTGEPPTNAEAFTILLPEGMDCEAAVKALAQRYIGVAKGDPVLAALLACQDVLALRGSASNGMMQGRKLIIDEL